MAEEWQSRALVAENKVEELAAEVSKWKTAFDNAITETRKLAALAKVLQLPPTERATYADAQNNGEAHMLFAEEHLCATCLHGHVCELAQAILRNEDLMPAVFRCNGYIAVDVLTKVSPPASE